MKGVTSGYTVNDLLRKRTEYRDLSQKTFAERMPDDIQITGFSIVNIGFPPEYTKAIRDKQVAREQAETEQFVLDRQRLTTTQVTQTAMAQRDADKARADGRAYEIKVQGEARRTPSALWARPSPRTRWLSNTRRWNAGAAISRRPSWAATPAPKPSGPYRA